MVIFRGIMEFGDLAGLEITGYAVDIYIGHRRRIDF